MTVKLIEVVVVCKSIEVLVHGCEFRTFIIFTT